MENNHKFPGLYQNNDKLKTTNNQILAAITDKITGLELPDLKISEKTKKYRTYELLIVYFVH